MAHGGHDHGGAFEGAEEVERVTRDGEVALPFVERILSQLGDGRIRRVLDVGPGPGVGTCELARLLPAASVIALEPSESMSEAIVARASSLGLADRVAVRTAGLPDGVTDLRDVDLVWASMSLHHVGDEVAALSALRETLAPGGRMVILERSAIPSLVLPDIEDAGLRHRLRTAYEQFFIEMRHTIPGEVESTDLAEMVRAAGLTVISDDEQTVSHEPPLTEDQRGFAASSVDRLVRQLADRLAPADRAAIEALIDDPSRSEAPLVIARRVIIAS